MTRTGSMRRGGLFAVLAAVALLSVACSKSSSKSVSTGGSVSTTAGSNSNATVLVRDTKIGQVLTDARGMTLYTFDKDKAGATTTACTGGCISAWPPLTATGTPVAGPGVSGTLAKISGDQVTWNGHPLYFWMQDHAPGDVTGDGVNGFHAAVNSGSTPTTAAGSTY